MRIVTGEGYRERFERLLESVPPDADYERSVFATVQLGIEAIEQDVVGARSIMHFLSFFYGAPVPIWIFEKQSGLYLDELRDIVESRDSLEQALSSLVRHSLIRLDERNRSIRLHRLVSLYAQPRNDQERWIRCARKVLYDGGVIITGKETFEEIKQWLDPGLTLELNAFRHDVSLPLMSLTIFAYWNIRAKTEEEWAQYVEELEGAIAQAAVVYGSESLQVADAYRTLSFAYVRRGRHLGDAATRMREVCRIVNQHPDATEERRESELTSFGNMLKDLGYMSEYQVLQHVADVGGKGGFIFRQSDLLSAIRARVTLSASDEDLLAAAFQHIEQNACTPKQLLMFVEHTLWHNGATVQRTNHIIGALAAWMSREYQPQLKVAFDPLALGISNAAAAEVEQLLQKVAANASSKAEMLRKITEVLVAAGAKADALDNLLQDLSVQLGLPTPASSANHKH